MFAFIKRWRMIHRIKELERKQDRAIREIVIALSSGEEIPIASKDKIKLLDAKISALRNKHKKA